MIFDRIENACRYLGLCPALDDALNRMESFAEQWQPKGRIEADGERLYANCMRYETSKDMDRLWEAHRKYIDIHVSLEGRELVEYTVPEKAELEKPYDAGIEASLYRAGAASSALLQPGYFAVFFPEEIHRAGKVAGDAVEAIRKYVVKAAYSD